MCVDNTVSLILLVWVVHYQNWWMKDFCKAPTAIPKALNFFLEPLQQELFFSTTNVLWIAILTATLRSCTIESLFSNYNTLTYYSKWTFDISVISIPLLCFEFLVPWGDVSAALISFLGTSGCCTNGVSLTVSKNDNQVNQK